MDEGLKIYFAEEESEKEGMELFSWKKQFAEMLLQKVFDIQMACVYISGTNLSFVDLKRVVELDLKVAVLNQDKIVSFVSGLWLTYEVIEKAVESEGMGAFVDHCLSTQKGRMKLDVREYMEEKKAFSELEKPLWIK